MGAICPPIIGSCSSLACCNNAAVSVDHVLGCTASSVFCIAPARVKSGLSVDVRLRGSDGALVSMVPAGWCEARGTLVWRGGWQGGA
jgi:hypothetical protein